MKGIALLCTSFVVIAACTRSSDGAYSKSASAPTTDDLGSDATGEADAGVKNAAVTRGPKSLAVDGDPNGLFWDEATSTLFIADSDNNRVLTYRDGKDISKYAALPPAPASGPGLGQLVKTKSGEVVVTRFGFGTDGDVVVVAKDKSSSVVPGLDKTRRRIGLTIASNGDLYDGYFVKSGGGDVGAVALLELSGAETNVVTGLKKTIGVLATGTNLFFDDQQTGRLYKGSLDSPASYADFAELPDADLLSAGPNGAVFGASADGTVRQIDSGGNVSAFATGFDAVRGVAYDAKNRRLFIANHTGTPGSNTLEIRPVP